MRQAVGFFVFLALLAGAVWIGLATGNGDTGTYELHEHGAAGRSLGSVAVRPGSEFCWELTFRNLPKAMQLHYDIAGPTDPVAVSLFEPPHLKPTGCARIDREMVELLAADPTRFYVDGHDSDTFAPAVTWAVLVEP